MGFVSAKAHLREYGETASLILQMTDEMNFDVRSVRTVPGGFECHDAVAAILNGDTPVAPEVPEQAVKPEPPASWSQPMPTVDVEMGEDGAIYLTDEAFLKALAEPVDETRTASLTEIREWAKTAGFTVADKGRISATIVEAYYAAKAE